MNLFIPVSYFFGIPQSEIWQLNIITGEKKLLRVLPSSGKEVLGKGITGLCWLDNQNLIACDFNRIFTLDRKNLKIIRSKESAEFNDLHSLQSDKDYIYVANTGRDSIDIFNHELELQQRLACISLDDWEKRKAGDYDASGNYYNSVDCKLAFNQRKVPDKWHLNHVFRAPDNIGGQVIATSFSARRLLDVVSMKPVSSTFPSQPHDGLIYKGELWVSTVSGKIYRSSLKIPFVFEMVFDLFQVASYEGWCRGLLIVDDIMFIGITGIHEVSKRTSWLNDCVDKTRSGIYQISMPYMEIKAFHDFSSSMGSRIFTIVADK